jgi:hypothetical protein
MTAKDVIQYALQSTEGMMSMYLSDLSDADILVRPVPGANHVAWQIGHLVASERQLCDVIPGAAATYPELPAGYNERHSTKNNSDDNNKGYLTKAEYLDLFKKTRAATIAAASKLTDAELGTPTTGQMAQFAPSWGALFILVANHTLMHGGQVSVVRRKLSKPVLM